MEPIQVNGYHGTNLQAGKTILLEGFQLSQNKYDWLGEGVYFWQDAPQRAWEWARKQFGQEAAVIHSVIRLEDCMDLLDTTWFHVLSGAYHAFLDQCKQANQPLPRQKPGYHVLDRAIINFCVEVLAQREIPIRVVRGAFQEGTPLAPKSAIFSHSHIQIAVRDTTLIVQSRLLEAERGRPHDNT